MNSNSFSRFWRIYILIPIVGSTVLFCSAIGYIAYTSVVKKSFEKDTANAQLIAGLLLDDLQVNDRLSAVRTVSQLGATLDARISVYDMNNKLIASYPSNQLTNSKTTQVDKVAHHEIASPSGTQLGTVIVESKHLSRTEILTFLAGLASIFLIAISLSIFVLYGLRKISRDMRSLPLIISNKISNDSFFFDETKKVYEILKQYEAEQANARKNEAVAQTTQMLAHDVRKPFTMLQSILNLLKSSSPEEIKSLVKSFIPEIQSSLKSVNGMISDVIEVGSKSKPDLEPSDITLVIKNSLLENIRYSKKVQIDFSYDLSHTHQLLIDSLKISRALSNIIDNGIQAMRYRGRIWFKTSEKDSSMKIVIGNSDSYIPTEDLPKIFDTFFTKEKKGGTGLGLAIAKKTVNDHGGEIWCTSEAGIGTEFHITLPLSDLTSPKHHDLPKNSDEIIRSNEVRSSDNESQDPSTGRTITRIENEIISSIHRPLKVIICDDEPLYQKTLTTYVEQSERLRDLIQFTATFNAREAIKSTVDMNPDVIIIDVDLGEDINGFEAVRQIRAKGSKAKICIHSNRGALDYQREALEAGADLFMPKPMGRSHLLNILLGSIPLKDTQTEQKGHYIVIDDNPLMLHGWTSLKEIRNIKAFDEPKQFWYALEKDPTILNDALGVITDYYFDDSPTDTGLTFAQDLRNTGYQGKIFLSSSGYFRENELNKANVTLIPKVAQEAIKYILN